MEATFTVTADGATLADAPPIRATIPGTSRNVLVRVPTVDEVSAPDASVTLWLADGGDAYRLGVPAQATVRVQDNDVPPTVSIADAGAITEGEALVFTVTLSHASARPVEVAYALSGTAAGDDYTDGGAGALVFAPGERSRRIVLETSHDGTDEPTETVEVALSLPDPSQAMLGTASATIEDGDLPAVTVTAVSGRIREGEAVQFELRRAGDLSAALTAGLDVSERGGDMVAAALEGARRVTFEPGAPTALLRVATADDGVPEPDSRVTVTVSRGEGAYEVGAPGSATVAVRDASGGSVLAQGRRVGAGSLLRRHVQRFSRLTSARALGSLEGGRRTSRMYAKVEGDEIAAKGDVTADLPLRWEVWASTRYSDLSGAADGRVWDLYVGADRRGADGRTTWGALIGYEPGRVVSEGVRLVTDHVQLGLYGAHRLSDTLTLDAALGWGRGDGDLSRVGERTPVTASYPSYRWAVRGDLTGDFGWRGWGSGRG